jgi:hypothetical protein
VVCSLETLQHPALARPASAKQWQADGQNQMVNDFGEEHRVEDWHATKMTWQMHLLLHLRELRPAWEVQWLMWTALWQTKAAVPEPT